MSAAARPAEGTRGAESSRSKASMRHRRHVTSNCAARRVAQTFLNYDISMGKQSSRHKSAASSRRELTNEERLDFLRVVRDDLLLIQRLNFSRPLRSEIRVASSILRRLLHELMLLNAWSLADLPGEPRFKAVDLGGTLASVDRKYIHFAYAGGASTEGAHHLGHILLVVPKTEVAAEGKEAVQRRVSNSIKPIEQKDFSLSEFCQSPCVASGSETVSRVAMVRYVANKLGGIHWDNQRGEWSDPVGSRHRLLDENHLIVGRLPGPLYEVLSIAQAVATSADTQRLIQIIDEVAPEEEHSLNVLRFREGRIGKYTDVTFNSKANPAGEV